MIAEAGPATLAAEETDRFEVEAAPRVARDAATLPDGALPTSAPPAQEASELPTREEIQAIKPNRVPSSRNHEIYRQVKILERNEHEVAREYGLTQPRISAICKQVRRWTEKTAGDRPGVTAEAKHNLAVGNARLRLSHTFSQAVRWLEVTGQPSQIERIKPGEQTGDVVKKGPNPKPALVGYMLRAAIELAKLERAYDPSPNSEVPCCECGECSEENPESRVEEEEESPPLNPSDVFDAMREARKFTPSEELLSARGAALAFAHLPTFRDEHANGLRADRFSEFSILDIAARRHFKAQENCYRAVAEAHATSGDQVGKLIDTIVDLDIAAAKIDALAWHDVLGAMPPEEERPCCAPKLLEQVAARRVYYLELLLPADQDLDLTDESLDAVIARYRPQTGRFDWRKDTGRRDLETLLTQQWQLEEEELDEEE